MLLLPQQLNPTPAFFNCLPFLIMFVLKSTSLSLTGLTTALRGQLSQQLRLHCHFSSLLGNPNPPIQTVAALRRFHFKTASSKPFKSSYLKCSNLCFKDSLVKTLTTKTDLQVAQVSNESVQLRLSGRELQIPLLWLRDHCRCPTCYNPDTFQKNVENYSLKNLSVVEYGVDGDTLSVKWQDGHISRYSLQWLVDNFYCPGFQADRFLWDGPRMNSEQLPTTSFAVHMNTEDGLKNTLSNLIKYGFCVVDGAPASEEGTEMVTGRISFPLTTVYGSVITMVSGELAHWDTAYTNVSLGAHTDTSYFTAPAGIQVFHCLGHEGKGGHTLLVDGFHAAEKLSHSDPEAFQCLITTPVPHEYIEGSQYHLYSVGTVLSTEVMSGQLTQIRFNPYDRAPLRTLPAKDIAHFYSSYAALTQIIRSEDSEFWLKLNPGMVLLVDNWRVMHGRSSFTGRRQLCSYYLSRDDWTSRARVLGLL